MLFDIALGNELALKQMGTIFLVVGIVLVKISTVNLNTMDYEIKVLYAKQGLGRALDPCTNGALLSSAPVNCNPHLIVHRIR